MQSVSKNIDQQKKKIKTPEIISLLTFSLLIYLMGSNPLIKTRLTKRIKTTKEAFGIIKNKNKVAAITSLQ